jgi:hypothetical protein
VQEDGWSEDISLRGIFQPGRNLHLEMDALDPRRRDVQPTLTILTLEVMICVSSEGGVQDAMWFVAEYR